MQWYNTHGIPRWFCAFQGGFLDFLEYHGFKTKNKTSKPEEVGHCMLPHESWQNLAGGSVITCRIPNFYLTSSYRAIASYLKVVWPMQWRSQSAADARAQHGHTKFASSLVYPGSAQLLRFAVRKCRSNQGGLGVLPQKILEFLSFLGRFCGYFRPYRRLESEHSAFATNLRARIVRSL